MQDVGHRPPGCGPLPESSLKFAMLRALSAVVSLLHVPLVPKGCQRICIESALLDNDLLHYHYLRQSCSCPNMPAGLCC